MAHDLARSIPDLAAKTDHLSQQLIKDSESAWEPAQDQTLSYIKYVICSPMVMGTYDVRFRAILSADALSYVLGAALLQFQHINERRLVAFESRSLTRAESHYAQIEKKALSLQWAADKGETLQVLKVSKSSSTLIISLSSHCLESLLFTH